LRGGSEQYRFKKSVERARSIQEVSDRDSIIARRWHAADFFNSIGPKLPAWALQEVVSYLENTGREAHVVGKAALDPELTLAVEHQALVYINVKKPAYSRQNGLRSSSSTS
jgi:hypothetical protein